MLTLIVILPWPGQGHERGCRRGLCHRQGHGQRTAGWSQETPRSVSASGRAVASVSNRVGVVGFTSPVKATGAGTHSRGDLLPHSRKHTRRWRCCNRRRRSKCGDSRCQSSRPCCRWDLHNRLVVIAGAMSSPSLLQRFPICLTLMLVAAQPRFTLAISLTFS